MKKLHNFRNVAIMIIPQTCTHRKNEEGFCVDCFHAYKLRVCEFMTRIRSVISYSFVKLLYEFYSSNRQQ